MRPTTKDHLKNIGLAEIVKVLQEGPSKAEPCVQQWLDVENDKDAIAAQEMELIEEVEAEFDPFSSENEAEDASDESTTMINT